MSEDNEMGEITLLLDQWGKGDNDALHKLIPKVYSHLRRLAKGYMRRESHQISLQATALVNEVYLRLEGKTIQFNDRDHFFRVMARMMRRLLISGARSRASQRRGPENHALDLLEHEPAGDSFDPDAFLAVEKALSHLEERHPRLARVVELRIMVGLQVDEIADVLEVSRNTVKRDWIQAKQRLYVTLQS